MAKRKLEVVIVGNDASLKRALGSSSAAAAGFGARMQAVGKSMQTAGKSMTRHITLPILGITAAAGKVAIDFDKSMRNVNSIAGLSEKQFGKLEKSVIRLGGKTAQSPKTLADGLYELVSSGFNAKQSMTILESSAKAATAGLTTTEVSTKAVAAVLNAYHLPASKAAEVSDTLFQTVNRGVITFDELASTVGDVLPFASSLGVGLDQVGAAVSTMTKAGIGGAETMTRIKNTMVAFLKPSKDMAAAIKATGANSGEALVKQKGFQGALEAVIKTTDGSKESITKLFPNIRALGGALALTGKNAKGAHQDLKGFSDVSGATNKVLAEQAKSVSYQWNKLKAVVAGVAITIGNAVLPTLIPILQKVAEFAGKAGAAFQKLSPHARKLALAGVLIVGAIGPAVTVLGFMVSGLAALASPIGIAVVAIVGLVVVAKKLGITFDDVKRVVTTAINGVKAAVSAVSAAISGWVNKNRADIDRVGHAFMNWGKLVVTAIKVATLPIRTVAGPAFEFLLGVVRRVLPGILQVVQGGLRIITGIIRVFSGVLTGDFGAAWQGIKDIVSGALKAIGGTIRAFTAPFRQAASTLGKAILIPIRAAFSALKSAVLTISSAILGVFSTMLSGAASFLRAMGKIPIIGGKFKGLANDAQAAANKINHVRAQLDALHDKTVHLNIVSSTGKQAGGGGFAGINKPAKAHGSSGPSGVIFGLENQLAGLNTSRETLQAAFDSADQRARRAAAMRGLHSSNKDTVNQAKADLRALNQELARTKRLSAIDLKISGTENAIRFKSVISDIRKTLKDTAAAQADVFRSRRESEINKAHEADLKGIQNSADAKELAALQATDRAEQDRRTKEQLDADLAKAIADGDVQAQKDAQDAIAAYERQKREEQLQANIDAATAAADTSQQIALDGLDQEVADYQDALDAKLSALTDNLNAQRISYAAFVNDLAKMGITFDASSDQEAAILGITVKTKKRTKRVRGHKKHRAAGGPVTAGESYIVGEHGQEVFTPDRNGRIIPNGARSLGDIFLTRNGDVRIGSNVDLRRELNRLAFKVATA